MTRMTSLLKATALAAPFALGAASAEAADVIETLKEREQFSRLAQAIEQAGLQDALAGEGPLTLFAPTNEAFNQLPQGAIQQLDQQKLQQLLQHHVVADEAYASEDLPERLNPMAGGEIDVSLAGEEIVLYSGPDVPQGDQQQATGGGQQQGQQQTPMKADIERVRVVEGDILADNGVIHAISGVLVPPDMEQALRQGQGQQQGQQQQTAQQQGGQQQQGQQATAAGQQAQQQVQATVSTIDQTQLLLTTQEGEQYVLAEGALVQGLQPGTRVRITYRQRDGQKEVTNIEPAQ